MSLNTQELKEIEAFAIDIALEAGRLTLGYFQKNPKVELKADNSPVTIADRGAEELLRSRIEKSFPDHGILGEEFGEKLGSSPARWILDPIDGTFSFVSGVPLFTNLVGLEWDGEMVAGVINAPALDEHVSGAIGLGARWNGEPTRVSDTTSLAAARLSTTSSHLLAEYRRERHYRRLRDRCLTDRGWADAYAFLLLATGRVDVVVESIMNIWDTAAPRAVVVAAGGEFTDWAGKPTHAASDAVASNGVLHGEVLENLRESGV